MSPRRPVAESRRRPEAVFIEPLTEADRALRELHAQAASLCESGNLEVLGLRRDQLDALCDLLSRGHQLVAGRIAALGGGRLRARRPREPEAFSLNTTAEPVPFFSSYRAGCRILCAAMQEALRLQDEISVLLLRELILRLEKQLWMIDVSSRNRGFDDSRAVARFLSC